MTMLVGALAALTLPMAAAAAPAKRPPLRQYLVLAEPDIAPGAVHAAVRRTRGRVLEENRAIGLYRVASRDSRFAGRATATTAILRVGRVTPVGRSLPGRRKAFDPDILDRTLISSWRDEHSSGSGPGHGSGGRKNRGGEPLAHLQWDLAMIEANQPTRHRGKRGGRDVTVGIIDTGIDASHPDIAPNLNVQLSRNFTVDTPLIDGPCDAEADRLCTDAADVDENGHGTHVAGTVGAAANRLGIAGVAPRVTLVNLRAGGDAGYFFLKPTLDAITYAGDAGIDVVNMSFYTDPWLFNCRTNPADSRNERAEQALVIDATQRAVDYARSRGVTLIAAIGNGGEDLGAPVQDDASPSVPVGTARLRVIDNTCVSVPAETRGVISVSAVGPDGTKPWYSSYGLEQTDIAAPGGNSVQAPGSFSAPLAANAVLSTYPAAVLAGTGEIGPDGAPRTPAVVRDCDTSGRCAYYAYEEGTSMSAPHVAGVAALVVGEYRRRHRSPTPAEMPDLVERALAQGATPSPCPTPPVVDYGLLTPALTGLVATCVTDGPRSGFAGPGVVNAQAAVRVARKDARARQRARDGAADDRDEDQPEVD